MDAMSLFGVLSGWADTPENIDLISDSLKVVRINTESIAAEMIDRQTYGDGVN